jgi:glutamyl/glutaminyl-tRNA synthetase
LPEAVLNFLALLGWSPGNDQEMFTLPELCEVFSLDKITKSGARFDFDKAKWFNQQYIIHADNLKLAYMIQDKAIDEGYNVSIEYLADVCGLMKERVHKTNEIISGGRFFFEPPRTFDDETIKNKYKIENSHHLLKIAENLMSGDTNEIEQIVKGYVQVNGLKPGEIMPVLRIAISGTMQGPDLIQSMILIGNKESSERITQAVAHFNKLF